MNLCGRRDEGVHGVDRPARVFGSRYYLSPSIGDSTINGQDEGARPGAIRRPAYGGPRQPCALFRGEVPEE